MAFREKVQNFGYCTPALKILSRYIKILKECNEPTKLLGLFTEGYKMMGTVFL
jgi:hypothetical protein